jgi:hypothetical protein
MSPLEHFFNEQMETAQRMLHADEAYWSGYTIGLLNGYLGDRSVIEAWHRSMLERSERDAQARGYREALRLMAELAGPKQTLGATRASDVVPSSIARL